MLRWIMFFFDKVVIWYRDKEAFLVVAELLSAFFAGSIIHSMRLIDAYDIIMTSRFAC